MSRNAISANPEHYIFKIFRGSMPPDPLRRPKKIFSRRRVAQKFFSGSTSPKQKILDRTLDFHTSVMKQLYYFRANELLRAYLFRIPPGM